MMRVLYSMALVASVLVCRAQERGFYLKPSGSYFIKVTPVEFPNVGSLQPRNVTGYLSPPTAEVPRVTQVTTSTETITGSFGQGWRVGLAGGYRFSPYLSAELSVNYFQSETRRMTRQYILDFDRATPALDLEARGHVHALDLAPSIVCWLPTDRPWSVYARVGLIVPVYGKLIIETHVQDKYGLTRTEQNAAGPVTITNINLHEEDQINPRPTIGFTGALGVRVPLGTAVDFFAEVEYRNISVSSKNKEITSYSGTATASTAGGSQSTTLSLEQLSYAERHTDYEDVLDTQSNMKGSNGQYTDPSRAGNDLRSYINIGGLGLNVGVMVRF